MRGVVKNLEAEHSTGPGVQNKGNCQTDLGSTLPKVDYAALRGYLAQWGTKEPIPTDLGENNSGSQTPRGNEYAPFSPGKHSFTTAAIVESNQHTQPLITSAIQLLERRLGPNEVASLRLFEGWLGQNPLQVKSTYVMTTILDAAGDVVAMASGSVTPTGLLLVGYTVSDEKYKGYRLGTHAYEALVVAAEEISKAQFGTELSLLALEASHGAEDYWRRQGFGEVYLTDQRGARQKLIYLQPPLNWIRESGEPENPEHYPNKKTIVLEGRRIEFPGVNEELMLKPVNSFSSGEISTEIVLEAIKAFYREYYFTKREVDSTVHERYFGYFYALMDSYYHDLTSSSEISLG